MQYKYLIGLLIVVLSITACSTVMDAFGSSDVVTTMDNVRPGASVTVIPEDEIPSSIANQAPFGSILVYADPDDVLESEGVLGMSDSGPLGSVVDSAFDIGKAFFPWLAAWEGALTLLFRRKRGHYKNAITKLLPGKGFTLPGALNSLVAGMGMKHTYEADGYPTQKGYTPQA